MLLDLVNTIILTPSYFTLFVSYIFKTKLYTLLLNLIVWVLVAYILSRHWPARCYELALLWHEHRPGPWATCIYTTSPPVHSSSHDIVCQYYTVPCTSSARTVTYSTITSAFKSLYICVSLFTNPFYIKNIYLTLLFLINSLLALYFAKYSLNPLSIYPTRNNPV
jgi:hypothetical protein